MKNTMTATELARNVGDVLARVRYRNESFTIERNGRPVARIVPAERAPGGTIREAFTAWIDARDTDPAFAEDLDSVNAADQPPDSPWES